MKHQVGLVMLAGSTLAWLLDLPGCVAGGADLDDVQAKLPTAIAEHVMWLRKHGEHAEELDGWEFNETVTQVVAGDRLFEAELEPVSRDQLERLVAHIQFARADLIAAMTGVPEELLDWEPPRSAFASFDAWAPEVRTIRGVAQHVYQFEVYYREGLRDGSASGIYEQVPEPVAEHLRTIERLRSLTDEERCRVWHPLRPGQSVPEDWTVRKVVRRLISHERSHAAEIALRRTWAWILPGDQVDK